jgi:hypothetical protein
LTKVSRGRLGQVVTRGVDLLLILFLYSNK